MKICVLKVVQMLNLVWREWHPPDAHEQLRYKGRSRWGNLPTLPGETSWRDLNVDVATIGAGKRADTFNQATTAFRFLFARRSTLARRTPRLKFMHTLLGFVPPDPLSFVYNVDIIKFDTVVPAAFEMARVTTGKPDGRSVWRCRGCLFRSSKRNHDVRSSTHQKGPDACCWRNTTWPHTITQPGSISLPRRSLEMRTYQVTGNMICWCGHWKMYCLPRLR